MGRTDIGREALTKGRSIALTKTGTTTTIQSTGSWAGKPLYSQYGTTHPGS